MALKSFLRWAVLGVLFIIPFIPLYVADGLFFPFISGKGFLFRILIEIGAGAWLLLALSDKAYRPKFSWTFALYAAFVVWMFIADLFAVNPHKAFWSNYERMDGWVTMIHVFLYFVVAGSVLSAEKLWKRWWLTVLGASIFISLYGLWQMFGLATIHQGGARADASFGNAIYLAVYLMFTIGIALWQAIESKGWLRYGLMALAAVQLIIVFATATRGVILGIFGAAFVTALLFAAKTGGKGRKIAGATLVLLLVLAGGFFLARDTAFVRSEPTLTRIATVFDSNELSVRMTLWGMAYQGFLERPVTGWGQEGYNFVFNKYYHPSLYGQEAWFDRAHNTYLDWLTAGGLPALLLFLALLASAVRALYMSNATRTEKLLLIGILAAYAIQAISAFDNLFSYILLAAVLAMAHERSSRPIAKLEVLPIVSGNAFAAAAVPAVLIATVVIAWNVNVPSMKAGGDLIRAASTGNDPTAALAALTSATTDGSFATQEITEQAITFAASIAAQTAVPLELRQQAVTLAFTQMDKELIRAPGDARLRVMYAQGLRAAGDAEGTLREFDAALALSPKKQAILFQRGIEKWQHGDRAGAAADFKMAYELDTEYPLAASYAAAGLIITGDAAGADALLTKEFGSTIVDQDILRFAYFDTKQYGRIVDAAKLHVANAPDDVQGHLLLAQAYAVAGRFAEARAEVEATVAAHPEAAASGAALMAQFGK